MFSKAMQQISTAFKPSLSSDQCKPNIKQERTYRLLGYSYCWCYSSIGATISPGLTLVSYDKPNDGQKPSQCERYDLI